MRTWNRRAVTLSMLAGLAGSVHGQDLSPPTGEKPVLFIQVYQSGYDNTLQNLCTWWPCDDPWDRNMIPMLPLNPNSVATQLRFTPSAYAEKLHRYYTAFVNGPSGQPNGHLSPEQQQEYEDRLAVQFFNFGGSAGSPTENVEDPAFNHPFEFWFQGSGDDLQDPNAPQGQYGYVNPWMTNRVPQIKDFMEDVLLEWTTGQYAIPGPKGGVYFDNEALLTGQSTASVDWVERLPLETSRWSTAFLPGTTQTMEDLWQAAQIKYGWSGTLAANLDAAAEFHTLVPNTLHGNRDIQFWFTNVGELVLTGATRVAGCEPLWAHDWDPNTPGTQTLNFPIANYGDYYIEERLNTGAEKFGWHRWRPGTNTQTLVASRDGWFGQNLNGADMAGSTSFEFGGAYYCSQCLKHPYLMRSAAAGFETVVIGAHARENGRVPTGSHHAPILYPAYDHHPRDLSDPPDGIPDEPYDPAKSLRADNLYLPSTHVEYHETLEDATIREARYVLDSMNFSGVSPEEMVPWIAPPGPPIGINNVVEKPTRDYFRRMLMLMRSKAIPRIQVFNLPVYESWNCARAIYDEVYGPNYADASTKVGTTLTGAVLENIKTTVPKETGAPATYSIQSVVGSPWGTSVTALQVDFDGLPPQGPLPAIGTDLRISIECAIGDPFGVSDPTSSLPTESATAAYCGANLRGNIYIWNFGNEETPPGWVQLALTTQETGTYKFPACFAGQLFDLSLRRDFVIPGEDLYPCTVINSGGKAKLLLVHHSDTSGAFISNWDLVQLAVYTPAEFCINAIVDPPEGPGPEGTGGSPEAVMAGADVNFDGLIDSGDLASFSNAYSDAAPLADYNGDELVTSDDALTFLEDFVEQID